MTKAREPVTEGPRDGIVKRSGAADGAFRILHEWILTGRLKSGDRLPSQDRLARQLGVSRNTLREAVHKLTAMGLLSPRQGVGTIVNNGSPSSFITILSEQLLLKPATVSQFLEARVFVERATVRLAAKRAGQKDLNRLGEILARQEEAHSRGDVHEFSRLDTEFHVALARASGNDVLVKFLEVIRDLLGRFILEVAHLPAAVEAAVMFHRSILCCLSRKDWADAEDTITRHLFDVAKRIEKHYPMDLDAESLFAWNECMPLEGSRKPKDSQQEDEGR